MQQQPPISIIIPTFNRAATIGKTIDSFIAQDYIDWEMLVVDDHSTDNTQEVIDAYNKRDSRIHYLLNERKKGAQGARNTGLLHVKHDWVVLFDSDDFVYPILMIPQEWRAFGWADGSSTATFVPRHRAVSKVGHT